MEVLKVTADSDNAKDLYPLLAQHVDKLNEQFLEIVITWFRSEYDRDRPETNQAIGSVLYKLAFDIQQLPLGSRANNIEIAIACYEAVLEVFSREAFPLDWATTQNNLGTAYHYRIRGERAENLEIAIACYREALKVYTREAFLQDWATTQNNLGLAYSDRIIGERAENIEIAIACYREALKVYSPEAFPQDWAMIQNNLGNAYSNSSIRGERADNIEIAMACYREAVKVYSPEAFPQDWAMIQNNLGNAYSNSSIRGERADNIEVAIACYREALKLYKPEAFPQYWATTQNNLAAAYNYRIKGERADNIEIAIAYYYKALTVRTRDAFPEDWAVTQLYLGDTLIDRFEISHQKEDIERAIALYTEVLDGYEQPSLMLSRPRIFYKLGKALSRRGSYPQAIEALEQCRILLEKKVDLSLLALAFFELARLYHNIHRLEKARLYYKDTLRLFRRLEDRESVADVAVALGNLELQIGRFEQAKERLEEVRKYYEAKDRQDRLEEIDRLLELLCKPSMAII
ncbi:MAG: SEL1-like repeat protein [Oscillatoria sp. SIO1A7]|nr:SEL1-like repeat protein [Oscillatoria sp. SIO1A7]